MAALHRGSRSSSLKVCLISMSQQFNVNSVQICSLDSKSPCKRDLHIHMPCLVGLLIPRGCVMPLKVRVSSLSAWKPVLQRVYVYLDPDGPHCNKLETVSHLILDCPEYDRMRNTLKKHFFHFSPPHTDWCLKNILAPKHKIKRRQRCILSALLTYVKLTKRPI